MPLWRQDPCPSSTAENAAIDDWQIVIFTSRDVRGLHSARAYAKEGGNMANHDKGDSQPLEGPGAAVLLGAGCWCCCTWYFSYLPPARPAARHEVRRRRSGVGYPTRRMRLPAWHTRSTPHTHKRGGVPRGRGDRTRSIADVQPPNPRADTLPIPKTVPLCPSLLPSLARP